PRPRPARAHRRGAHPPAPRPLPGPSPRAPRPASSPPSGPPRALRPPRRECVATRLVLRAEVPAPGDHAPLLELLGGRLVGARLPGRRCALHRPAQGTGPRAARGAARGLAAARERRRLAASLGLRLLP